MTSTATAPKVEICSTFADDEEWFTEEKRCGWIPLGIAAHDKSLRAMKKILKADTEKRSLNMGNDAGWTPLYIAVDKSFYKGAEYLLKMGANPNIATCGPYEEKGSHMTPLSLALSREGNSKMVDLLKSYGAMETSKEIIEAYKAQVDQIAKMATELDAK